jgi:glycosyltransferase involved in cell wall biosynthesis
LTFSIITVSYNSGSTLEQTIESVLSQDYAAIEYIVVDGASTDNTVSILEKYKNRINYISEKDGGIYDAMNKGLTLATGSIIGFIGADDFYPNTDVISAVANTFDQHKTDAVYGDNQFVSQSNTDKIVRYWKEKPYQKENWLKGWMPPHLTFYLKKSIYNTYGHYKTYFKCAGDYELMLRMLYKNNVSATYLPKVLMTMRTGGTSNASLKHRWVANQEDRKAWLINGIKPRWYTLLWKPLSKISQLIKLS